MDEDLVSGFISALISFIDSLHPPSKSYKQEKLIRTVDRGDFKIIIESGEYIIGILFVNIEKVEVRIKLREIIQEFENSFDLKNWTGSIDVKKFTAFQEVIFKKFATEIIQISDVPILSPSMKEFLATNDEWSLLGKFNLSAELVELLVTLDGTSDVQEISNRLERPVEEVIEKIGYVLELGDLITLESPVHDTNIYVLTPEAMAIFRHNTYERETIQNLFGEEGINILMNIDGSRSVQAIQKKTADVNLATIKEVLRFCSMERLIKRVRVHPLIREPINYEDFTINKELTETIEKIVDQCDGKHSLREIAKNLELSINFITDSLVLLGDFVSWRTK